MVGIRSLMIIAIFPDYGLIYRDYRPPMRGMSHGFCQEHLSLVHIPTTNLLEVANMNETQTQKKQDVAKKASIPFYATTGRRSPSIILAIDVDHIGQVDSYVETYLKKNLNVVVLVGDRFNVEPYLKGSDLPEYAGKVSAQPAWAWCSDNMPFARDVVFIP